jgi:hypothetical protein
MLESRIHVKYPKLGNPVLIWTWQHNGEVKLSEGMKTRDIYTYIYCHALGDRRRGTGLTIGFITHNRTLKYNTTESLRTPSVFYMALGL